MLAKCKIDGIRPASVVSLQGDPATEVLRPDLVTSRLGLLRRSEATRDVNAFVFTLPRPCSDLLGPTWIVPLALGSFVAQNDSF